MDSLHTQLGGIVTAIAASLMLAALIWMARRNLSKPRPGPPLSPEALAYLKMFDDFFAMVGRLREGEAIPDDELIAACENLNEHVGPTSCDAAATRLFSCVGAVLRYRPGLAERLLPMPMHPLFYYGALSGKQAIDYLEYDTAVEPGASSFQYSPESRDFLKVMLGQDRPHYEAMIDAMFAQFEKDESAEIPS